jgi:hypothetical protein
MQKVAAWLAGFNANHLSKLHVVRRSSAAVLAFVDQNPTPPFKRAQPAQKEVVMSHLILTGDNITYPGIGSLGESSLTITIDDTGTNGLFLNSLELIGPPSVSIVSKGDTGGSNHLLQLVDGTVLTTGTISGSEPFFLGSATGNSLTGDGVVSSGVGSETSFHSLLTLIDASATTGVVKIFAGATNHSSGTISYTGLTIKGGLGSDTIENDAKNGIVTDGNGTDVVYLGGAGAKATLGTGSHDTAFVGFSQLGTNEVAGSALGDKVTFGAAGTADLVICSGAEAGSTVGTTRIGLTKVVDAAAGMATNFASFITSSSNIVDETAAVASSTSLTAAENAAVKAMGSAGVAYFTFGKNEYFIATNNAETAVSAHDAIVELVGITDIHSAHNSGGVVTLA